MRTHCFRGHELTKENTIVYCGVGGMKRKCKTCDTAARHKRQPLTTGTCGVGARMNQVDRFMRQVVPIPIAGCWMWSGAINGREGYGQIMFDGRRQGAHRVAVQIFKGPIPDGMFVLHHCDTPGCVNPEHLYVGSLSDNSSDRERRGRGADNRGSKSPKALLTEEAARHILTSTEKPKVLAERFGVHPETIYTVLKRRSWRHVQAA